MVCWQVLEVIEQHYLSLKRKRRLQDEEASTTRRASNSNDEHHEVARTTALNDGDVDDTATGHQKTSPSHQLQSPSSVDQVQQQHLKPNLEAKQVIKTNDFTDDEHSISDHHHNQKNSPPHRSLPEMDLDLQEEGQNDEELSDVERHAVDASKLKNKKKQQQRRALPLQRSSMTTHKQQEQQEDDIELAQSSSPSSPSKKKQRVLPLNHKKKSLSTPLFTAPSAMPTVTPSSEEEDVSKSTLSKSSNTLGSSTGTYDDDDRRLIEEYVADRDLDLDDPFTQIITGDGVQIPTAEHVEQIKNTHPPIISGLHGNRTKRAKISLISWNIRLRQLQLFKNEYGHTAVPQKYLHDKKLGIWVNKQREEYKFRQENKRSSMTNEKLASLELIGFEWAKRKGEYAWDQKFAQLEQFKQDHGHCRVKTKNKTNPGLGRWVSAQRHEYRKFIAGEKSILCQERINRLNGIGFTWSCLDEDAEAKASGGVDGGSDGGVDEGARSASGTTPIVSKSAEPSSPPPKGRPMPPKMKVTKQHPVEDIVNEATGDDGGTSSNGDVDEQYHNFNYFGGRPIVETNEVSSIYDDNEEDRDRFEQVTQDFNNDDHGTTTTKAEDESSHEEMDDENNDDDDDSSDEDIYS